MASCRGGLLSDWSSVWWSFIHVVSCKVVFHQGACCQGGLSSLIIRVPVIRVVFYQGGLLYGGLLAVWSLVWSFSRVAVVRVVFNQCSCSSGWSFIRVVCSQGDPLLGCLLSEWSFIRVPVVRVVGP